MEGFFSGTNSPLVQVWAKCIENESMLAAVSMTNSHWVNNLISLSDYIYMKANVCASAMFLSRCFYFPQKQKLGERRCSVWNKPVEMNQSSLQNSLLFHWRK